MDTTKRRIKKNIFIFGTEILLFCNGQHDVIIRPPRPINIPLYAAPPEIPSNMKISTCPAGQKQNTTLHYVYSGFLHYSVRV